MHKYVLPLHSATIITQPKPTLSSVFTLYRSKNWINITSRSGITDIDVFVDTSV